MRFWFLRMLLIAPILSSGNVFAYPDRPITIINTNAAGNTGDIAFRIIQPLLEKKLGQPLIVVNKPGASGEVALSEVVRSAPDGYTLLLAPNNNYVMNQFLLKSAKDDPLQALVPVTTVSAGYSVVVVPAALPVTSLKEFQSLAKKQPGKMNYGSPGNATPPHLAAAAFAKMANVDLVHIPYRGSPAVVQGLLTNDVQIYFSVVSAIKGHLESGGLKAIAVAAPTRLDVLPDVPTTAEAGFPELISSSWWGLAAPKGIAPERLERLVAAVQFAFSDDAVVRRFKELNISLGGASPEEMKLQIEQETKFWKGIIPLLGIQPL